MPAAKTIQQRFQLDGKVALITGASKGIGEAMARGMAEFGAQVMVSSRNAEAVTAVAEAISANGYRAAAYAANAGNADDLQKLVAHTVQTFGGIDIVVNNAATNPVYGQPMAGFDTSAFDKILAVNLKGPFELCKLAYPSMRQRGGGSIINISSIGGIVPEKGIGMYSISKAALINMTQVLAQDWGPDRIRANAICPGLIQTRFSEALWSDSANMERFLDRIPLRRLGHADDIAGLAVFLASDASAYCTGSVFMADGGYTWT